MMTKLTQIKYLILTVALAGLPAAVALADLAPIIPRCR